ncbi:MULTISPECIES: phytanoyl-CoA dioxygenase family protein [Pacificimonas]|uniref:Phytanoyl-CoA dioxygenase family protein n=1 Tax=Pacificimonas aurantium TaxID=1250540 RepID=A0ABS7WGF9_9SPHN|nr:MULTISPECIES: phytanoyl-CoA dioxygenase family protein [Pacificimonas]MBZ6377472.1 phytanoyl-CoA dioxygenase family protein [Pacificimonas aurantium]
MTETLSEKLERTGSAHCPSSLKDWLPELEQLPWPEAAGLRIDLNRPGLNGLRETLEAFASDQLGVRMQAVRATLFDKCLTSNWSLGWHQDRTVAVSGERRPPGYKCWNRKSGVDHCQPPLPVLRRMLTARVHLDPVDDSNGPLEILEASHAGGVLTSGAITEIVKTGTRSICLANPGDIWLYKTLIVHRSGASNSSNRRRVLQLDFSPDSALPGGVSWAFARKGNA